MTTPNLSQIRDELAFNADIGDAAHLLMTQHWESVARHIANNCFKAGFDACEKYARAQAIRDVVGFMKYKNEDQDEISVNHYLAERIEQHFAADLAVLKGGEDEEN